MEEDRKMLASDLSVIENNTGQSPNPYIYDPSLKASLHEYAILKNNIQDF